MTPWWEFLIMIPGVIFAGYAITWSLPGAFIGIFLGLGNPKRIIFIDKQLSKDADKLHSNGLSMASFCIISRFMDYCIAYPFIRYRVKTKSKKFRMFMWVNSIGFWSYIGMTLVLILAKLLGIME